MPKCSAKIRIEKFSFEKLKVSEILITALLKKKGV